MTGREEIDEAELHAFVDGRLDAADRARVSDWLRDHPDQQARLQAWAEQADALRHALSSDEEGERAAILARIGPIARRPDWRGRAATILLALAVGGAGGWLWRGDARPTEIARLGTEAAMAYRVFANDGERAVEISADDRAVLVARLSQKLGHRIVPPDLSAQGYRLMGGRVLTAMYGPAAMLLYSDAGGDRITVYLQPMRLGLPEPMRPMPVNAVDGYAWISRQVGYSVMSEGDRTRLHAIADQVHAETQF